jgi:hypothetical protein
VPPLRFQRCPRDAYRVAESGNRCQMAPNDLLSAPPNVHAATKQARKGWQAHANTGLQGTQGEFRNVRREQSPTPETRTWLRGSRAHANTAPASGIVGVSLPRVSETSPAQARADAELFLAKCLNVPDDLSDTTVFIANHAESLAWLTAQTSSQ